MKGIEYQRRELWKDVWVNTANSDSCVKLDTPTLYADEALKQFDKRFKPYTEDKK